MFRLIILCLILILSGMIHLMDPFSFANAIPLFIPHKLELIYATGVLELILATGLLFRKTRTYSSKITSAYFLLLLPIHVYVSVNEIPMFGFSDPYVLWGRTLFQFVFIWWAYSLRKI